MPNLCKDQFRVRYFGFDCNDDEKDAFYISQWTKSRIGFLIYRIVIWMYVFGWWLAYYINGGIHNPNALRYSYRFLTMWGRWFNTVYLSLALALAIVGFLRRHRNSENAGVKWLRGVTWMFHSIAQTAAVIITIVYWAALTPYATADQLKSPFNIDIHAINSVVFLIEIFVVAFPMRLFHALYPMIFAAVYIIATLIFHAAGDTSAVYPIIDWENNPGLAAGLGIALCVLGTTLVHSIFFGLYSSRTCCCKAEASDTVFPRSSGAIDNPVFLP